MRKVVAGLFITLDGVVEAPHTWQFDFDDEMGEALTAEQNRQDAILLGRVTYQEWVDYWPTADTDIDFRDFINNTRKYVVSTTLDRVEWQNSTLLKGNLADEVARLKGEPGKNIGVHGSPSVARSLLYEGLLDELVLLVHPVFAGSGKRLIPDGSDLKRLELVNSVRGASGTMILTYHPRATSA
jgi:dihydrofolate reductase